MRGNVSLLKTKEKQFVRKIFAKIFPVSGINVNYTERNQRLINSCIEGESRVNPVSNILKAVILMKANLS